jgi:hypothetical protein
MRMSWPGLSKEVTGICKEIHLPDACTHDVEKEEIRKAIKYDHLKSLKLDLKGEKLMTMANSDVSSRREYTTWRLEECRMAYRLETKMFLCRANMPTLFKRDLTFRACTQWGGPGDGRAGRGSRPPGGLPGLRQPVGRTGPHVQSNKSTIFHEG